MLPKDPMILLSFVNTKLRDEYSGPAEMCEALDEDFETMNKKLAEAGFSYNKDVNQYR